MPIAQFSPTIGGLFAELVYSANTLNPKSLILRNSKTGTADAMLLVRDDPPGNRVMNMIVSSKIWMSVSAAAMLATTGVAQAGERPVTPNVTAMTNADAISTRKVKLSQRYCIVDSITGSRIDRKDCATLAEWQVRGIDPRRLPLR